MRTTADESQTDLEPLVTVEGEVERIVYESEATGFFVARLHERGNKEPTTFVGNLMAVSPGETVRLRGRWVEDKRFGRQLRVESFQTIRPSTVEGIERYLSSGLIAGIGPSYAKRLVTAFGVDTLRVIDEEPRRLLKVPGIGKKRAARIREAWASQKAVQSIMLFLQGHGISTSQAVRIYKIYGDAAVAVLRENPYRLAEDIPGISFQGADKIAAALGIARDSELRLVAGLAHVLSRAGHEGHVYLPVEEVQQEAGELLEAAPDAINAALERAVGEKKLVREGECVYSPAAHATELGCAQWLRRLLASPTDSIPVSNIDNALKWAEKTLNIELSPEQRLSIRTAIERKVVIITGGPGTGKTTVINSLLSILDRKSVGFLLAAPTGRAAKRMEAATQREARTIHRLLEFSPLHGGFDRNEHHPLETDLVVLDEMSMVDQSLFLSLLKALPAQARLVLVGDVDQLPSVGPGNVLFDIIASQTVPVVHLATVFRQAAQSGIISNAHRINSGQFPQFNQTDFFLIERHDPAEAASTVEELVVNRVPRKFSLDPMRDIQVLSPMRRGEAGVNRINERLQAALNPHGAPVPRRPFRGGDKVMQLRNNYERDVFNGDVGIISTVDVDAQELEVTFDDGRVVLYPFEDLDDLGLAYAATIHKSQGSEYEAVIFPVVPQHYVMLQRNLLYTAITRGKRLVILVGHPKAIGVAVRNSQFARRYTRLAERLRRRDER